MESDGTDEFRTAECTQKTQVLSRRVLVQRACNHNAVEVYRYDTDGKLTAAETDITTWEERNTEIYGWLNADPPPFEPRQPVDDVNQPTGNDPASQSDYEALLDKMASQVREVPAVKWSTVASGQEQTQVQPTETVVELHTNSERVDGSRRSHSEHRVTLKSSALPINLVDNRSTSSESVSAKSPATAEQKPRKVWTPSTFKGNVVKPWHAKQPAGSGPSGSDVGTAFTLARSPSNVPTLTSLSERQHKRCAENRIRKASGKHGQFIEHQQEQIHQQQRQWRHVDGGRNY